MSSATPTTTLDFEASPAPSLTNSTPYVNEFNDTTTTTSSTFMSKKTWLVIGAVLFVLIGTGAGVYYFYFRKNEDDKDASSSDGDKTTGDEGVDGGENASQPAKGTTGKKKKKKSKKSGPTTKTTATCPPSSVMVPGTTTCKASPGYVCNDTKGKSVIAFPKKMAGKVKCCPRGQKYYFSQNKCVSLTPVISPTACPPHSSALLTKAYPPSCQPNDNYVCNDDKGKNVSVFPRSGKYKCCPRGQKYYFSQNKCVSLTTPVPGGQPIRLVGKPPVPVLYGPQCPPNSTAVKGHTGDGKLCQPAPNYRCTDETGKRSYVDFYATTNDGRVYCCPKGQKYDSSKRQCVAIPKYGLY